MQQPGFDLERYEFHVYRRAHEPAARELVQLLLALDASGGRFGSAFSAQPTMAGLDDGELDAHVLSRIAAATMCLFADPGFRLAPIGVAHLLNLHRWLGTLFAASPLRNADAVLRTMNLRGPASAELEVRREDLAKLCLLFNADSRIPLNLEALWAGDRTLAAGLCLSLLAPRFVGSLEAHAKREVVLPWLASRLDQIDDLDALPTAILHDAYMHCSYADRADKHAIKRPINALIRRKLAQMGLSPATAAVAAPAPPRGARPLLLVVLEWFNATHSIYRTHSRTLEAARARFRVVGIGQREVDAAGRAVFDTFVELPADGGLAAQLHFIADYARREGAQVLYMPSVGMFPLTMFLANLRLAPLQLFALGHPATTLSPELDYAVVEEDYVGDPACFSEPLLLLPRDGMPYRPSAAMAGIDLPGAIRPRPQVVEIAIAATTMKLNPGFLAALARIADGCGRTVRFHFLVGQELGLVREQVVHAVRRQLGERAVVYAHQPYAQYMQCIAGCDLFLDPFPFGNTNGIVDTVAAGLVGVCRSGREVHECIDGALFRRLGLPEWLVTHDVDGYVAAAVRLVTDDALRAELRRSRAGPDKVRVLFEGRPEVFGRRLLAALRLQRIRAERRAGCAACAA